MTINRLISLMLMASAIALPASRPAAAAELVYGSWTPAQEYQNRVVMPELFRNIEKDTDGAIKWKLIAGGQIADGKTTFTAVKDGLMQAGLAIVTYVPNAIPSVYAIYSTLIFGENDPVAASGAALETMYLHCPSCLEEFKAFNAVGLSGWTSSAYVLTCREPIRTVAELKGKRIRATGGAAEMFKLAGAVPVGATLVEAVGLLQRGGLDCQYGIYDWLRTFGYADVAKYVMDYPLGISGPAIGMFLNRDSWKSFTLEQKRIHVKYAAWLSAKMAIGNFVISNEDALATVIKDKGRAADQGRLRRHPGQLQEGAARCQYRDRQELRRQGSRGDHRLLRAGGRALAAAVETDRTRHRQVHRRARSRGVLQARSGQIVSG